MLFNVVPTLLEIGLVCAILGGFYAPSLALVTFATIIGYIVFTFSITDTSANGSPGTATISANFPASIVPKESFIPSSSAAVAVPDCRACAGVIPNFTIDENSFAGFTFQSNPPASVPNAIFTPAFIARRNVSS